MCKEQSVRIKTKVIKKVFLAPILFITPIFYSIGNASEMIQWGKARSRLQKRDFCIIGPYQWTQFLKFKICNRELFKVDFMDCSNFIWHRTILICFVRLIINCIFIFKRTISLVNRKYIKSELGEEWDFPLLGYSQCFPHMRKNTDNIQNNKNNLHKLLNDCIVQEVHKTVSPELRSGLEGTCKNELMRHGIDFKKKFICLHVRDSGYYNDGNRRSYRNADIANYKDAILYLTSRGFTVFRMGDSKMKKLQMSDEGIIDYPFTLLKSEGMDLFLIKNCEFFIGMQSGIYSTAILFNKPVLNLNMYDWFHVHPLKTCDRGLLKQVVIKGSDRPLTLNERFNLPFYFSDYTKIYQDEIVFIENSRFEILNATKEFLLDYYSGFKRERSKELKQNYTNFRQASTRIISLESSIDSQSFFSYEPVEFSRSVLLNLASKGALYR
jgi:putative glycosyltransferase (TIGR04372 family)